MKKLIISLVLGIFLISCVSAVLLNVGEKESLGIIKSGEEITLIQNCLNSTYSNITLITFPNSSISIVGNYSMNKSGDNYNYSYSTSPIGFYNVYGVCDENGMAVNWVYYFEATQTGYKQSTSEALGSSIYLVLMISLTLLFVILGFKFSESDKLWVFGTFLLGFSFFFMVYDLFLGYTYYLNYIGANNTSAMPQRIFYLFLFILVAGLLVSAFLLVKYLPKFVSWLKIKFKGNEDDGWDENNY